MNLEKNPHLEQGFERTECMCRVSDQVSLRVFTYTPAMCSENIPVLIISGLSTKIDSFKDVLNELSKDHTVYFVETRDKPSSQINGRVSYDIESMGRDIASIVRSLGIERGRYILMGYSFGASIIAECYRLVESKPYCVLFMEPTPAFHYPKWSLLIIRWLGVPLYRVLKPVSKWYLKKVFINTREDNEMALITSQSLDNADPRKLRNTILDIADYKVWDKLDYIDCPVLVIGTSKDHLHIPEEIDRMVSMIKTSTYIDLETNQRTHSPELGHVIRNYINSLTEVS